MDSVVRTKTLVKSLVVTIDLTYVHHLAKTVVRGENKSEIKESNKTYVIQNYFKDNLYWMLLMCIKQL